MAAVASGDAAGAEIAADLDRARQDAEGRDLAVPQPTGDPGESRDSRQSGLVPPDELARTHAVIVGVGAIGRQVALQLAAMGVPQLTLIDHDTVEVANLGPQGWAADDIGRFKVDAAADLCQQANPQMGVYTHQSRFRRSMTRDYLRWPGVQNPPTGNGVPRVVAFCCVDSMEARKLVWESVFGDPDLNTFIDGRMSGEVMRVVVAHDEDSANHYPTTLFADSEAQHGACTARSTIYTSNIVAGLMVHAMVMTFRDMRPPADQMMNLLAGELTVTKD